MIITIDDAIPYWKEAFAGLGELRPYSGNKPGRNALIDADALIVRSVTPVNAALLEGSAVGFVAAASAGIDHVDLPYLYRSGIGYGYAPGCNANSVSEYITAALCVVAGRRGWALRDRSIAIVGVGNVGGRVAEKARAFGMEVLLCDPPLREQTGDPRYRDFDDVLGADFLTFHVPLVPDGAHPTYHMLNREVLGRLSPGQIVLNTSRGAVFDNRALRTALLEHRIGGAVLDVWEDEPRIDYSLLGHIDIGTPHIAGSSLDGKIRATEMVCGALHDFFRIPSPWKGGSVISAPKILRPEPERTGRDAILSVILKAYNILDDDANLRKLGSAAPAPASGAGFEQVRRTYPFRAEFPHFTVVLDGEHLRLSTIFKALGFQVRQGAVL